MAVYLATASDYLRRTSSLLNPASSSTVTLWYRPRTIATFPAYQTAYVLLDGVGTYAQWAGLFDNSVEASLDITGGAVGTGAPFTVDVWVHLAWVQSGTTQRFYVNGVLIGSFTQSRAAFTVGEELLGNDSFSVGNVEVAYARSWQAALTQTQIAGEMFATHAVRTSNLFMDTPLTTNLLDVSGNGRNWTQIGSGSFVAGPDIPTNRHPEDAIALPAVPFDVTQTIPIGFPTGATNSRLWYSYTPPADTDIVAGIWPHGSGAEYIAETFVWRGDDPLALTEYVGSGSLGAFELQIGLGSSPDIRDAPLSIPVRVGQTYYLQIINSGTVITVADTLHLSGRVPPNDFAAVLAGAIMVSDDTGYFPLAALDPTTGAVLDLIPFRSDNANTIGNESDDTLPDGTVLAEDSALAVLHLYDASYTETATIPYPSGWQAPSLGDELDDLVSNRVDAFYVGSRNTAATGVLIIRVTRLGAIGLQTWTLPGNVNRVFAPNAAETQLYYGQYGAIDSSVSLWNLVTDTAAGSFVAAVTDYRLMRDILVLSSGDVIVGYQRNVGTGQQIARRYSSAGVLQLEYEFGLSTEVILNRMAFDAGTSDLFFWAWLQTTDGSSRSQFVKVRVSDGQQTATPLLPWFEIGSHRGAIPADPDRFGHSQSCPFWIQQVNVGPPTPPPPPTPVVACPPVSWLSPAPGGCVARPFSSEPV